MGFKVGEAVVYGGSGVCEVSDITDISFYREKPQKYYVLKPMFVKQASVIYVPMNNEEQVSKIQPVISREEAVKLIKQIPIEDGTWIEDRNERKDKFNSVVNTGSHKEIIEVASLIINQRTALLSEGKRLNAQDERILEEAIHRISSEFAVALDMEPDEVDELIRDDERRLELV